MVWADVYKMDEAAGFRVRTDRHVSYDYSDGVEAEAYVLECISSSSDVSAGSDELARRIRDWPSEYHLSASRSTLLAPFDFAGLDVLEVGSGCGALTRVLGESGARVVALEGSFERARITAARCRGLDDVHVVCGDLRDFTPPQAFDVVLMIGVLEYAPLYFDATDPVAAALRAALASLTEDGTLILAIENQLGLKYFAGSPEDHTGQAFFGIEDRYHGRSTAVTFGRQELRRRLTVSGFAHQVFFYPFPDYKLPRLILTEDAMAEPRLPVGRLVAEADRPDRFRPHARVFSEDATWQVVARNGLLGDFSNAFLVAASSSPTPRLRTSPAWLAELRSTDRARGYRTVTRFTSAGDHLEVKKARAEDAVAPSGAPVEQLLPMRSLLLPGVPLGARIRNQIRTRTMTPADLAALLKPWVDLLRSVALSSSDTDNPVLPGNWLDGVPWNLMEPDPTSPPEADVPALAPFDLEWRYTSELTLDHVVFRGLLFLFVSAREDLSLRETSTTAQLMLAVARELQVFSSNERLEALARRESELQSAVHGLDRDAAQRTMDDTLGHPLGTPVDHAAAIIAQTPAFAELEATIAILQSGLDRCQQAHDATVARLAAVEASSSWRLTAPLRRLRRATSRHDT